MPVGFGKEIKLTSIDAKLLQEHPDIIAMLQKAYNNEYLAWFVYEHGKHFFFGPWRDELIGHFEGHAKEELCHADWVASRLVALGEPPALDMKIIKRATTAFENYEKLLAFVMQLEGEAVALYVQMLTLLEGHPAMRNAVEGFVDKEQEHFEDFEKVLRLLPETKMEEAEESEEEPEVPEAEVAPEAAAKPATEKVATPEKQAATKKK